MTTFEEAAGIGAREHFLAVVSTLRAGSSIPRRPARSVAMIPWGVCVDL
jgi:hypothetical protein